MPKSTVAKTTPVAVGTAVEDLAQFRDLSDEMNACEKKLKTLKPRILALVPEGQTGEEFETTRHNVHGYYNVTRVERVNTTVDYEALIEVMWEKKLIQAPLSELIERGKLTQADIKKCTKVSTSIYPLVSFKPNGTKK